ncbi:MAG: CAP domain-containing protein [Acidimicrobiales bacterium]|nr:CAP domain-containing protein [Acidimicrobiales bacterium]
MPVPARATLPSATELEKQFQDVANQARAANGLPPLMFDQALAATARTWAGVMQANGSISHDPNLEGAATSIDPTWTKVGENIGIGPEVATLQAAWMASPSHRANILDGAYNRIGIGVVVAGGQIWVAVRFLAASPLAVGEFHPLTPTRILDTRTGLGMAGGAAAPVLAGLALPVKVSGLSGVPASQATAVALNVTVINPTATSHLTLYPKGSAQPPTSNINFVAGQIVANLADIRVGRDGSIEIMNSAGGLHLAIDIEGYWDDGIRSGGTRFTAVTPTRLLDTRTGNGLPGGVSAKVPPGGSIDVSITGRGPVPGTKVTAVVLNVTAVNGTTASHVTAWPTGLAKPLASMLNFRASEVVPNLVIVPIGTGGKVSLYNNSGSVDLIADVAGYYDDGTTVAAGHAAMDPRRVLDTRFGPGPLGKIGPGRVVTMPVRGVGGVAADATAVVLNLTATGGTAATHLTVYPGDVSPPLASNLNVEAGQTKAVLAVVRVGADGTVKVRNNSGSVHVILDIAAFHGSAA